MFHTVRILHYVYYCTTSTVPNTTTDFGNIKLRNGKVMKFYENMTEGVKAQVTLYMIVLS